MKQIANIILFIIISLSVFSQSNSKLAVQFESLASSSENLPFWLVSNQLGKYNTLARSNQVVLIEGKHTFNNLLKTPLNFEMAANAQLIYSNKFKANFNELYAKAHLWNWRLEGGLFQEPIYFNNLSSTNGSIDRSNNNSPYPRIRLTTNEFIPFLFWKSWFSFKAEYDEGILNDERVVKNTHLHHKSLYLKVKIAQKVSASVGLNHYVMWGGISPAYGELPSSFKDYITYITGGAGTSNFPTTDQQNVAGNQLGSYHTQIDFPLMKQHVTFYVNHPFEDHSGMEFDNRRDNLYGVFIEFKEQKIISKVMYEHMYTIHQSGHIHEFGVMRGRDNYFNHGYYRTGFTYKGYTLASPLFSPVNSSSNQQAIENNRISMHHIGLAGTINNNLSWDGKFTFSSNLGTYNIPYEKPRNQFSSLLNICYQNNKLPLDISLSIAADFGQMYEKRVGGLIRFSKNIFP